MAIKAIFVGINKHLDAAIPELSGARRDAMALWALFTDTVEGLAARLIVDESATHAAVSQAILGALSAAGENDVVVITFAGHGSPDGSLVLFDTNAADLAKHSVVDDGACGRLQSDEGPRCALYSRLLLQRSGTGASP